MYSVWRENVRGGTHVRGYIRGTTSENILHSLHSLPLKFSQYAIRACVISFEQTTLFYQRTL